MIAKIAITTIVIAMLAGCGCGGGSGPTAPPAQSFAGEWSGAYTGTWDSGTADLFVNKDGGVTGTIHSVPAGITSGVSGTIQPDGTSLLDMDLPNVQAPIGGRLTITERGLVGDLTMRVSGTVSFSLPRVK